MGEAGVKSYRVRFMPWGLALFGLIMLPNLFWFAAPAEHDALKQTTELPWLDMVQMVFQAMMIGCLCMLDNVQAKPFRLRSPLMMAALVCCGIYYVFWAAYFCGSVNGLVLLALCLFPSAAFLLYAVDRCNMPGVFTGAAFALCHLVITLMRLN